MDQRKDEQERFIADISREIRQLDERSDELRRQGKKSFWSRFFPVPDDDDHAQLPSIEEMAAAEKGQLPPKKFNVDPSPAGTSTRATAAEISSPLVDDASPFVAAGLPAEGAAAAGAAAAAASSKVFESSNSTTVTSGMVSRTRAKDPSGPSAVPPMPSSAKDPSAPPQATRSNVPNIAEPGSGVEWRERLAEQASRARRRQPILQRWWFPWLCMGGIFLIWTPDKYKVKSLMWLDEKHEQLKAAVHLTYWKYTMPADQYALLLQQLEANVPKGNRVKASDCPL
jgi:hypothetical protein